MRFSARHTTTFRYNGAVYLEPHVIRLRPRSGAAQRLVNFLLRVTPKPDSLSEGLDAEGNVVAHAVFSGTTEELSVVADFEVETLRPNPFDYILVGEGAETLPLEYPAEQQDSLARSLARPAGSDPAVDQFLRPILEQSEKKTLPFLDALNQAIYKACPIGVREHGEPYTPAQSLAADCVACRDLAVLFMDCCRAVGIAARFVSGYQEQDGDSRFMHAWAEAYLPGGGWRGYDPTQGLVVGDRHIAVAAASAPLDANPIDGSFRGDAEAEPLEAEVRISVSDRH